jgi:hypothetical protein
MSSSPPHSADRATPGSTARRPRYLVVALIGALVFGVGCWTEGCGRLTFYHRGDPDHGAILNDGIKDDADRAHADELYRHFVDVSESSRGRSVPLSAATFVLGAALLALAARGLAGKSNTRSALIQVVAAQATVVVATYFLARDVRNAELDWQLESSLLKQRPSMPADQYREVVPTVRALRRWVPPIWLVFRTVASGLIVIALTRARSREFFEAAAGTISER